MDLVLVQPDLSFGGAERQIIKIAERFNPIIYVSRHDPKATFREFREFDIRVAKPSVLEAPVSAFARLDSDNRMAMLGAAGVRFLGMKVRDDYDVINAHLMPAEWIRNRNERVCWYCHCPCRPAYGWKDFFMAERGMAGKAALSVAAASFDAVERAVVPKIEKICTNSKFTSENVRRYIGRGGSEPVYPGADVEKYSCKGYEKIFFYPSRVAPEKRMEIAIEAFRKFSRKGWKLVIGGFMPDMERNRSYLARLREIAGSSNVEFVLDMNEKKLMHYYSNCYAVLFTPMLEDWGLVPVEAMASHKPVIAIKEGGPAESVVDGKTGFLISNADEMAEKMRFLADHPDICEQMGKAGRKRVEQNYTWKIFLDRMEKVYKETAKM